MAGSPAIPSVRIGEYQMAIATLDGVVAGMQWPRFIAKAPTGVMVVGRPQSLWKLAGSPGVGGYSTTLAGAALSSTAGQVPGQIDFRNPGAGNTYLARLQGAASAAGTLVLADRLWHNGGFTITAATPQIINSVEFPARDNTGTINGAGVLLGLEVSAACGAATPTISVTYTESGGATGRVASNVFPTAASPSVGAFFPLGMDTGDIGVKAVTNMTLSASWVSGTVNLVAYRPLAALELTAANIPNAIDAITSGMPRLFDGSVPFFYFIPAATTTSNVTGQVVWTQG
jgi:hypothetical protein